MKTREDLKKDLLEKLESRVKIWNANAAGCSESVVRTELERSNYVMQNIDEAASIAAANEAAQLLYLYASNNMDIAYNTRGIEQGDAVDNLLNSIKGDKSLLLRQRNNPIWDQYVQKIYGLMGTTTVLPTHSEIIGMEYEIEKLRATGADENTIINLEEQVNLKKCALGELTNQWSAGIPWRLSGDVKRAAQVERITQQAAVSETLNTTSSIKR